MWIQLNLLLKTTTSALFFPLFAIMDYFFPFTPQYLQTSLRYYFPFLIFQHLVVWISSHILIFLQHFFPPFPLSFIIITNYSLLP